MKPSAEIISFIRDYEKCSLVRYPDQAGKPTIGFGHLLSPSEFLQAISQDQADELFARDLERTANALCMFITCEPSQQQFDAVLSLAFNEGVRAIGNSTLMGNLNMGATEEAAYQFGKWIYVHEPISGRLMPSDGLRKRRAAEQQIFERGVYDSAH